MLITTHGRRDELLLLVLYGTSARSGFFTRVLAIALNYPVIFPDSWEYGREATALKATSRSRAPGTEETTFFAKPSRFDDLIQIGHRGLPSLQIGRWKKSSRRPCISAELNDFLCSGPSLIGETLPPMSLNGIVQPCL